MEKEQRTRLQKATQDARRLLEEEFRSQLLQTYDIDVEKVRWAEEPGAHLLAEQRLIREKLMAWIEHKEAQINDRKEALLLALREMAFTALNRFVALKLMEARELVRPCVTGGLESAGFLEFTAVAQGLLADQESSYRLYLETIFEDVSRELRALFDPRDPASLLWPKRAALLELLDILNRPEMAELWSEDETLGWVYQYFNGDAERKKMREESAAPRNSRELAVRNQFFTPRYVVEFLTDNTLGRIWYEMRQGNTSLKDRCRYLVSRPNEIWLQHGEEAPAQPDTDESLSQEELLRQPVHIPHRELKDPREIRMLDPACGSMHFGLYAFDLYLEIYTEAWEIAQCFEELAEQGEAFAPFVAYAAAFTDKAAFLREIPTLILQYNIHGIDIDPRATQIARLTLWLRAQRAWKEQLLEAADRPQVTRSNVVCAEPMPGEQEQLADFVDHQFSEAERGLVQQLLEAIFDKMKLAGEAGSLLKIEDEIRDAIDEARREWQKLAFQQRDLFSAAELAALGHVGASLNTDLQNLTRDFWVNIEERIYAALRDYAEQTENSGGYQRQLFAEDAAQGFAFIDVCRKRYDVALMNPPFGEFSARWKKSSIEAYPDTRNDIFAAFTERALDILTSRGNVGAITSRTGLFLTSFGPWRKNVMLTKASLHALVDFGQGVMDNAMVEAAAYTFEQSHSPERAIFIRALHENERQQMLFESICRLRDGILGANAYFPALAQFKLLTDGPFVYWTSPDALKAFAVLPTLKGSAGDVRQGLATADDPRFARAIWEAPYENRRYRDNGKAWTPYIKAGASQPWFSPITLLVNWGGGAAELWSNLNAQGKVRSNIWMLREAIDRFFFKPGFSWTRRAVRFIPYVVPEGCIPSASRYIAYPHPEKTFSLIGISASNVASSFLRFYGEKFHFPNYMVETVKLLPWPSISVSLSDQLRQHISSEVGIRRRSYQNHEPFHEFTLPLKIWAEGTRPASLNFDFSTLLGRALELEVASAYGLTPADVDSVSIDLREALACRTSTDEGDEEKESSDFVIDVSAWAQIEALVSYLFGVAFGRWDIRYATGEQTAPELPDPFAPLPICPPGQLQNTQGLPAGPGDVPASYPVPIPWDGILVDDPNHPLDLEHRISRVIEIIWSGKEANSTAEAIERESCDTLQVKSLRDYFRKSAGFFADHLKRYSKSRRQAPVYWQLSVGSGSYSAWLYYHRFTQDTLYRVLRDFVEPRIQQAEREQFELESQGALSGEAAARLQEAQTLLQDLRILKSELDLVAPLWNPNLNDGVIINHAILWRITPYTPWQKKCKECWDKLEKGDYDWAHLAFHLWPERVIPKCTTDRSLAIAHGLEERLWQETNNGNWLPRQLNEADLQALIAEHTNPAVKNALERFLAAPPPVAPTRTRASRSTRSSGSSAPRRPRGTAAVVDAEATRQVLLALTAAPSDGLAKAAIADLIGVEANAITAVIKQLKESGQIDQLGERRGARYVLSEQGRAKLDQEEAG